jgi:general secretion pathway protein K
MAQPHNVPPSERGAALLSILLLVAILSVIATTTLDRVILSTKLASNGQAIKQARMLAYSAEDIALARIADLRAADSSQTTLAGGWLGNERRFQLPGGTVTATLYDGGNCFNLNSLVQGNNGTLTVNPAGREQFVSLMAALSVPDNLTEPVVAAAIDWADSDTSPQPGGAEDGDYQAAAQPYLPANRLYAHKSELRAVRGVNPALYKKLSPFLCALPKAQLSPINVNTLLPEQAALLAMLYPPRSMSVSQARSYLAKRPAGGYGSLVRFWDGIGPQSAKPAQVAQDQVKLVSNWFMLGLQIESGGVELRETALIAAENGKASLLWRSWGDAS